MAGTTSKNKLTTKPGSDIRRLQVEFNNLVTDVDNLRRQVTYMMPGCVVSAPATKAGTSDAATWRNEGFNFAFRGKIAAKAAAETAFTDNTHDVAASKEAWFVLSIQTNGTLTITKGADQTIGTIVLPTAPDNEVVVAYLQIVTGATGWAATADDLTADGPKIASLSFVDAPSLLAGDFSAAKIGNHAGTALSSSNL